MMKTVTTMKRVIFAIQIFLLATLQALAYNVTVGSKQFEVPVRESGTTYTIGNGQNASIPQYEAGTLTIPRVTNANGDKNVIGKFAFRFCTGITKIVVEEGITAIEDYAFVGCSGVTTIELPASLERVGRGAFVGLSNLTYLVCKSTTAPVWSRADVFSYEGTATSMAKEAKTRILYVPTGYASNYTSYKFQERVGWSDAFTRIYEMNDNPQEITSLQELKDFRDAVNSGTQYKGSNNKMVTLTTDLDMSSIDKWTPIGNLEHPFDGVFDGGGHVIKNLKVDRAELYNGLFGYAQNATIYNMHLKNPSVSGSDYQGTVLGYANSNTHLSDILVTGTGYLAAGSGSVGGIVGHAQDATIERCMFYGQAQSTGWIGGIVGNVDNNVTITDCAALTPSPPAGLWNRKLEESSTMGGIVGGAGSVTVNRCYAKTNLKDDLNKHVKGHIVGKTKYNVPSTITNCGYWNASGGTGLIGTQEGSGTLEESGNQGYLADEMKQDGMKNVLGTDNWYYFTGNYYDYPIPATLKDMYLANCVDETDANGIVYRPAGANNNTYEVVGYTGSNTTVTIPEYYNSKPVIGIVSGVFKDNATLTSISAGLFLQTIGDSAFENCDALTSVYIPNLVTIGDKAFYDCDGLTSFSMTSAVTTVGEDAFAYCDNLASFQVGKEFKNHKGNFLTYCPKLTTITVADGNTNGYKSLDNVLIQDVDNSSYIVACAPGKTGDYRLPENYVIQKLPLASAINGDVYLLPKCFASCNGLTSITSSNFLTPHMGKALFDGACNLKYVDFRNTSLFKESDRNVILLHLNVDRGDPDNPFYGLSDHTIIYLPKDNTAEAYEPNVFIMNQAKNAATANHIFLEDGFDFNPKVPVTATNGVRYERYINYTAQTEDEGYSAKGITVCLPYAFTLSNENAKVYAPSTIDEESGTTTVTFTEVANKQMSAYTPYYVVMKEDQDIDFSISEEAVIATPPTSDPGAISGFMFKGTTVEIPNSSLYDANKPAYLLQSDGKWHEVPQNNEKAYVGPFRAYFQTTGTSNARVLNMSFVQDATTAIAPVVRTIDADGTERYYDMSGRQLNGKPQKGMYIHNGKKHINK